MDSDIMDDSVFDDIDNDESDGFEPEPKPKAKAPAKKPAAKTASKKMVQTTLKSSKTAPKKRAKPESDEDDDNDFSNTPPSAKKQKKAPAAKKAAGKPLAEISNDSMVLDGSPDAKPTAAKNGKNASETYQKLTQLEHILLRPDTYIGSVERTEQQMWVLKKETEEMELRPKVGYVPGLYKIFDEILVNAADNKQRDPSMTTMKVTINRDEGQITVENNGKGIPVEMHDKENVYIPELVFGHLLAGSNFDDTEKRTVGGRNGFGAKLCNVFSTEFTLECQDSKNGKRYKQTWRNNMSKMEKAKITSNKTSDFVRVTFKPDFARFNMPDGIDDDLEALMCRRVYDMAGTIAGVKVHLNDKVLKLNFKQYCTMYAKSIQRERGDEEPVDPAKTVIMEDSKDHRRWEIGFAVSDGSFQQVSFVNSIATTTGGTHVNYIADKICESLLKTLNRKKKGHSLKASHIRNHIFIFINCFIDNPSFNSQTKEQMTLKVSQFGSKCELSDKFLKAVGNTEAIANIIHFADAKADKMLAKSDGNKRSRISNAKLVDANLAGTKRGHECTLILTEGDSAKSLAVAGRAVLDPDRIGVFPLRGKILNVRDATVDQISKNAEIQNIKQFMGLKHKQEYTSTQGLRYGRLMIMADQDHDGSHIKGLLINFLQVQYPSLLKLPGFFREFITPIVKVWQGNNPKDPKKLKSFFNQPQYDEWRAANQAQIHKWHYKYFKGLGTSSNEDAQVYFNNLDDHLKLFDTMKSDEPALLELAFSNKKADARKAWLGDFVPGTFLDHTSERISYTDFVNRELILFSMSDNIRSVPSVLDGLKPGGRKILYACLKRNLTKDKKVVEVAGFVSEETAYHHGEQSLQSTIVNLAQNFVGSNNVNCLEPSGNFGSRLAGGKDAASARYIHTRLSPFARRVFSPLDEPNLEHQLEDGKRIEPKNYAPVIPMVLANGAEGIGSGWSTNIPNHNPSDIVRNLRRRMGRLEGQEEEEPFESMLPWYRGWKGEYVPEAAGKISVDGKIRLEDPESTTVIVDELPVGYWTDQFKAKLEEIIKAEKGPSFIKDYKEFNDHNNVYFEIQMDEKSVSAAVKLGLKEKFKLTKTLSTTNMVAFNTRGQIQKYETVQEILEEFYHYRLGMYTKRKEHWLGVLDMEHRKLNNQARFIREIMDGKLVVSRKKKAIIVEELTKRKYEPFSKTAAAKKESDEQDADENEEEGDVDVAANSYDYLLSMPIWSFTQERLDRLGDQIAKKKAEHDDLAQKSEKDLWCADLDEFEAEWEEQLRLDTEVKSSIRKGRRASKKIGAGATGGGRGRKKKVEDDDFAPTAKAKAKATAAKTKAAPVKSSESFAAKFGIKSKSKSQTDGQDDDSDAFSEDDYAALKNKPVKKEESLPPAPATAPLAEDSDDDEVVAPPPANSRSKRAAASKAKTWVLDDDDEDDLESDDDDKMLGDVGAMVKGIGGGGGDAAGAASTDNKSGRLSLYAMSRPESSHGAGSLKLKTKASKMDLDDHDDTNYELLAKSSSPQKPSRHDDLDNFSSDDDEPAPAPFTKPAVKSRKPAADEASGPAVKKPRGRAAAAKGKAKEDAPAKKAAAKPTQLSPAAKAYAAKKTKPAAKKSFDFDDDDDEDDDEAMPDADSPPPKPAARGRPGRAAAAKKPSYMTILDDDSDDAFAMDSD